jgi:polysaccharide pyruvyl transferase WcaK-like protein
MHVVLYCAITKEKENSYIDLSFTQKLKLAVRRTIEINLWSLMRLATFKHYSWSKQVCTNKGDIGIRISIENFIRDVFHNKEISFQYVEWFTLEKTKIEIINQKSDLFVLVGGGYIFLEDTRLVGRFISDCEILTLLDIPKIAIGLGVNKLGSTNTDSSKMDTILSEKDRECLMKFREMFALFSVRDEFSRRLFGDSADVINSGDAVFLLKDTVSNRSCGTNVLQGRGGLRIGLNIACHGRHATARLNQDIKAWIGLVTEIYRRFPDAHVHYMLHDEAESIIVRVLRQSFPQIMIVDCPPLAMISRYAELDVVINQMLHSCIFSFISETPVINITYDIKTVNFFKMFSLERWCLNAIDNNHIISLLEESLTGRKVYVEAVNRTVRNFQSAFAQMAAELPVIATRLPPQLR